MQVAGVEAPLVAICMATHKPPLRLLAKQIESIRAQTHTRFVCIVSDDASPAAELRAIERLCREDSRFAVSRNPTRLGFYRNFERSISLAPAEAVYVALADQDDVWYPDKLATLIQALETHRAMLSYSDMAVVTSTGDVIASSCFGDRRNNYTDLESLMLMNTVTGAASVFRREVIAAALPFPNHPSQYHDHWVACVALALGEIAFVNEPLVDYVQHETNIVGRRSRLSDDFRGGLLNAGRRLAGNPRGRLRSTAAYARRYYVDDVLRLELVARTLEDRLARRMTARKARAVRRVAKLRSPTSLAWLVARSARDVRGDSPTLGMENQLIKGILWHWQAEARRRLRPRRVA